MADDRKIHRAAGRKWGHYDRSDVGRIEIGLRVPVVYVLYRGASVVYVGRTEMPRRRLLRHARHFEFTSFKACIHRDKDEQMWHERKLIFRLRPSANRSVPTDLGAEFYFLRMRRAS